MQTTDTRLLAIRPRHYPRYASVTTHRPARRFVLPAGLAGTVTVLIAVAMFF